MAQRGRVSMAALMVKDGLVAATPRPDAHFPVLAQLCRHIVAAEQVAVMLKKYQKKKDFNYRDYAELLEAASGREFVDHAAVSFAPPAKYFQFEDAITEGRSHD
jgi:hypothetical protein